MGNLTGSDPKCLVRLCGKPMIELQLAAIRSAGITEIAIVTGWQGDKLTGFGAPTFWNARWAQTNMVVSLACASEWLRTSDCFVSYSDIFYTAPTVEALMTAEDGIAISYDPNWLTLWRRRFPNPLTDAETFRMDARSRLTDIGQRATKVDEIEGQYMGLLRFTPSGWAAVEVLVDSLPEWERDKLDMTTLLRLLIVGGTSVQAISTLGPWGEVDTQSDLELYEADAEAGLLKL